MSAPAPGARTGSAAGTAALVRLVLRRDRLRLPLWYGLTALFVVGVAAAVPGAYPTEEARQALVAATAQDPTQLFAIGPVHGSSVGAVAAWRPRGRPHCCSPSPASCWWCATPAPRRRRGAANSSAPPRSGGRRR
ncbi:hypothetical protein [Streptomonospora nanhaiensis]|uniref:hypothetical protein n=1 Tax=Streptomonospora nanhaiensis TaxID=1323731 RepID=UPI001C389B84|nr:hypothetical protein [Streptomonospora nanhaiensis]MBV2365470.1 hypothetical protein [Streptomonospora nanhaiensis]